MSDTQAPAGDDTLDKSIPPAENASVAAAGRQRETHMGFARMLATIAFVIALPVALVTTNIRILANAPLVYDYSFDRYNAEDVTGLSRADLDGTGAALRQYFNNDEKTFFKEVTVGGLKVPVFNARETRHMEDVKRLFVAANRAQELSVVYVLLYIVAFFIWAREGNVRQLAGQALVGAGICGAFIGGVALFAAFGFERASVRFHTVFFNNNLWMLDPSRDRLIQMFPDMFWRDISIVLGAMTAAEVLLISAASTVYLLGSRRERRHLSSSVDVTRSTTQAA